MFFTKIPLELFEGDVCNRTEGKIWTCQRPEKCATAVQDLLENKKPAICCYDEKTPIICCKDTTTPKDEIISRGTISEGDECDRTVEGVWTCQRPSNCPSAIKDVQENKRPAICSYDGKTPIICCRDTKSTHEPLTSKKSQEACQRYQELCRHPLAFRSFPADETELPPLGPFGITGGIESAPKEHPQMVSLLVFGGVRSAPKEYKHMALIGYGEANSISWSCGGSLISDQYILSAAHCTNPGIRVGPARWARLGDLNIATHNDDAKPNDFAIVSRINYPEYKPPALYNDIALYKLNQSVTFSPYIFPVCLQSLPSPAYEKVIATGWGRIGPSGPKSKHLMKVQITIVPQETCKDLIKQPYQLPRGIEEESMICAGELEGGKDTCEGDSGGPLMQRFLNGCVHQQIGITSFGRICGTENSPGVYTRIAKFIPWIESIVWP